jgi:ribosome-binding protein aMBF1 (putative translation factor)
MSTTVLRCDMCGKPIKSKRFQISVFMRPERTMTVGPDCYKKEKVAVEAMKLRFSEKELAAKREYIAANF